MSTVYESGLTAAENGTLERRALERIEMQAWVATLAPWELAFTGTFRWEASMDSARRSVERWMKRECPEVTYFYALERNPNREGYHVHSLWSNTAGMYRRNKWASWFERFGRNRLEPIRCRVEAENYLTKYVTKQLAWWNTNAAEKLADKPCESASVPRGTIVTQ